MKRMKWFLCSLPIALLMGCEVADTAAPGSAMTRGTADVTGCITEIPSPESTGPFAVGYYKVRFYSKPYGWCFATLRYPAMAEGLLAKKLTSGKPYPGIVIANGIGGTEWSFKWAPRLLSSHGYITLCFTPPNPFRFLTTQWAAGFNSGIEKLKSESGRSCSPIADMLDASKIGVMGFSMGGGGCIEAAGTNPEIRAVVPLSPYVSAEAAEAAAGITAPMLVQAGTNDGIVACDHVYGFYSGLGGGTIHAYAELKGANHIGYLDQDLADIADTLGIDREASIDIETHHAVAARYFTSWFNLHLRGIAAYEDYLRDGGTDSDLARFDYNATE